MTYIGEGYGCKSDGDDGGKLHFEDFDEEVDVKDEY